VVSSKLKLFAVGLLVIGSASYAYACGDDNKSSSAQASVASTSGSSCATMSKAECASKVASGQCASHKASASSASLASSAGDHCGAAKGASMAGQCTYGASSVTYAGACPAANEADYSFAIAGAECQGTGAAAAKAIKSVKGVASVTVDYDKHMAYVCADSKTANQKAIAKSLKAAGFDEVKFVSVEKQNCAKSHGKVNA
jgi:copper chaperone CopZ